MDSCHDIITKDPLSAKMEQNRVIYVVYVLQMGDYCVCK